MISRDDMQVLEQAGIADIERLAASAAEFIRAHPVYEQASPTNALSEDEERTLMAGGAVGVGESNQAISHYNLRSVVAQYAQLVERAYRPSEVASLLGVTTSRVRQRSDDGSLYALTSANRRFYPRWQFDGAATLPNLEPVLNAIGVSAHPLAVERFFLTPHPDLESDLLNAMLCPRDWLLAGHSPDPVIRMAREL
ncbi:hypothetical protein SAMN02745148_02113 [Modicisalibacter ilicicola DSM 19980]|uniref:Uncharacterized protein n=1 Tax=Modicisalibacter ilicicola DSM 19980 TaxID=1121942 RepID=A0A1M4ZYY1_9GAMM|nr:hypothetical protein [Halomonas ilicicola]SHF23181.1 hypothetical protein SAMN02745148_02113 [Halomonas ilicicola DSM 19980]